jgi:hypothetical protein
VEVWTGLLWVTTSTSLLQCFAVTTRQLLRHLRLACNINSSLQARVVAGLNKYMTLSIKDIKIYAIITQLHNHFTAIGNYESYIQPSSKQVTSYEMYAMLILFNTCTIITFNHIYQQKHITGLQTADMFYKTATCFEAVAPKHVRALFLTSRTVCNLLCAFVGNMTQYTNCKGIKSNTNLRQITGIQKKLDITCK